MSRSGTDEMATTHRPFDPVHSIFEARESNVRSYCRAFPTLFTSEIGRAHV